MVIENPKSASSNHHVNQALRAAGIAEQIGKVGYNGIISIILKSNYSSIFESAFSGFLELLLDLFI